MATVWNGIEMLENVSEADAKKMVKDDTGQWVENHDGSAFKERKDFSGYHNKAMATSVNKNVKKVPTKKAPTKKTTPKK